MERSLVDVNDLDVATVDQRLDEVSHKVLLLLAQLLQIINLGSVFRLRLLVSDSV